MIYRQEKEIDQKKIKIITIIPSKERDKMKNKTEINNIVDLEEDVILKIDHGMMAINHKIMEIDYKIMEICDQMITIENQIKEIDSLIFEANTKFDGDNFV